MDLFLSLPDPRGAYMRLFNLCLSVRPSVHSYVRPSPFGLVLSYTANIPRTPNIFTDFGPPIKGLVGGPIKGDPTPLTPPMGGLKFWFGDFFTDGPF